MENIQIDTVGKILAGDDAGMYVKVIDDFEDSGGFLVLTSENRDMKSGFDNWVQDQGDLIKYFQESGWEIAWE